MLAKEKFVLSASLCFGAHSITTTRSFSSGIFCCLLFRAVTFPPLRSIPIPHSSSQLIAHWRVNIYKWFRMCLPQSCVWLTQWKVLTNFFGWSILHVQRQRQSVWCWISRRFYLILIISSLLNSCTKDSILFRFQANLWRNRLTSHWHWETFHWLNTTVYCFLSFPSTRTPFHHNHTLSGSHKLDRYSALPDSNRHCLLVP